MHKVFVVVFNDGSVDRCLVDTYWFDSKKAAKKYSKGHNKYCSCGRTTKVLELTGHGTNEH